jgi:hypothetical protein
VAVAALTVYDMVKAVDKSMTITDIYLVEKTGGRSGTYRAADLTRSGSTTIQSHDSERHSTG